MITLTFLWGSTFSKELQQCSQDQTKIEICHLLKEYQSNNPPSFDKNDIHIQIDIKEIIDINESKHTVTLIVSFHAYWTDDRIGKSNDSEMSLDVTEHYDELWIPEICFRNAVKIEKLQEVLRQVPQFDDNMV